MAKLNTINEECVPKESKEQEITIIKNRNGYLLRRPTSSGLYSDLKQTYSANTKDAVCKIFKDIME